MLESGKWKVKVGVGMWKFKYLGIIINWARRIRKRAGGELDDINGNSGTAGVQGK